MEILSVTKFTKDFFEVKILNDLYSPFRMSGKKRSILFFSPFDPKLIPFCTRFDGLGISELFYGLLHFTTYIKVPAVTFFILLKERHMFDVFKNFGCLKNIVKNFYVRFSRVLLLSDDEFDGTLELFFV